jgi:predicted Co/Zn/Cd cation transporter (cation efflux family)
MLKASFIVLVALAHFLLTLWASFASIGTVMAGFDGGREPSAAVSATLDLMSTVLRFPLMQLVPDRMPGTSAYVAIAANTVLWGLAVVVAASWLMSRRQQRNDELKCLHRQS